MLQVPEEDSFGRGADGVRAEERAAAKVWRLRDAVWGTLAMGMGVVNILENTVAEMDRPRAGEAETIRFTSSISNMHDCVGPRPYVSSIHA